MSDYFNTISVIGLGYIGLPTAAVLASRKIKVIGVDINQRVVETINKGQIHIIEPELDIVVSAAVSKGYLRATLTPEAADAFLIAVPTPFIGNHEPDIRYVEAAARSIAPVLKKGDLVILESTSPVGTTEKMVGWLADARPDLCFPKSNDESADINIAYCPERVLPGRVLQELINNDRIIGGVTKKCSERAIILYKEFVAAECVETDVRTAEMCKLTENSYRDVNIAFANELSLICDRLEIDVWELIKLANRHPRVDILQPGSGVGGHCIAVDPWFIVNAAPEQAKLIHAARLVNDQKPEWVIDKIKSAVNEISKKALFRKPKDVSIACFGITFKANIDDLRESPSLSIAEKLSKLHDGPLFIVEPNIEALPNTLAGCAELVEIDEAIIRSDILVFLVAHRQFWKINDSLLKNAHVIDVCGIEWGRGEL